MAKLNDSFVEDFIQQNFYFSAVAFQISIETCYITRQTYWCINIAKSDWEGIETLEMFEELDGRDSV